MSVSYRSTKLYFSLQSLLPKRVPTEVPANCTVKVNTTSGECLLSVTTDAPRDLVVLSMALISVIAKKISAPRMSLHLVWPILPAPGADTTMVDVQCIVSPINQDNIIYCQDISACHVCQDPCPHVDSYNAPRSAKENCVICSPDCLCALCRVQRVDGAWCCFDCLRAGDEVVWNASSVRRAHLVGVGYKTATAAMPVAAI
jgi:hypothetical protein